jgi:chitosanase
MLTPLQKKTAQAIVNIFETGRAIGDYGSVTLIPGDSGHLTYGRSQTTLASGNLALLIHAYCAAGGVLSADLRPFLPAFDNRDLSLDSNEQVKTMLRSAGSDPVMRNVQDAFFDRVYWAPAIEAAGRLGITLSLGAAVVYDSKIHGSFERIRAMTDQQRGAAGALGERKWVEAYVEVRRNWLATHANNVLHGTVYRMDAFKGLIAKNAWDLTLPLTVRNVIISAELLDGAHQPVRLSAMEPGDRVLFLTTPMMKGDDVRRLQTVLKMPANEVDGTFGQKTDEAVRTFQLNQHLTVDGKAGPATLQKLETA